MALGRAFAVAIRGLDGITVEIEAHISGGLPGVHLVGLPDYIYRIRRLLFQHTPIIISFTGEKDMRLRDMVLRGGLFQPLFVESAHPYDLYLLERGNRGEMHGICKKTVADYGYS